MIGQARRQQPPLNCFAAILEASATERYGLSRPAAVVALTISACEYPRSMGQRLLGRLSWLIDGGLTV